MSRRLLRRYLADRTWLLLAFGLAVVVLVTFFGLVLSFLGVTPAGRAGDLAYALLLAALVFAGCLGVDLARWWPAARWTERLLGPEGSLETLAGFPDRGTREQAAFGAALARLQALTAEERLRYQEAHQRQITFVSMWAHQLKTPLAAISLAVQDAAHGTTDAAAALASIEEETLKLADGLELVLNTTRLQDFALDYHIRRVDLLHSVRQVANARKRQFIRLGIFPAVDAAAGEDWHVLTDEKWNAFAIDQIVSNALKYGSQTGRPDQRVRFSLTRTGDEVALGIADDGPGIPPQDLPRVFEPFFTGENGRRYAHATGIGLFLVKRVMEELGHRVAVRSVEGEGTTVTLRYAVSPHAQAPRPTAPLQD